MTEIWSMASLLGSCTLYSISDTGERTRVMNLPTGKNFSMYHSKSSGSFKRDSVSPEGAQSTRIRSNSPLSYRSRIPRSMKRSSNPGIMNPLPMSAERAEVLIICTIDLFRSG